MSDHSHRGATPGGPLAREVDRRVLEVSDALAGVEAFGGALPALGFFKDASRAAAAAMQRLDQPGRFTVGTVVLPLPYVNWFRVQTSDSGSIAACMGAPGGSLMPSGPKDLNMPGPNDRVLVFKPAGLNHGVILCVLPNPIADGSVACPDWVSQGSGAGLKREEGYKFPVKGLYRSGGVIDWSDQRPQDQTPIERGWVSPFGTALTIDDEMVQVRASEMAGLWCCVLDSFTRLAGQQLLVESGVHELDAGDDEGEARHFTGVALYPHEALGQYAANTRWTAETDAQGVQYSSHKAAVDLPAGQEDAQAIYRWQEFGGYLGQGHVRLLMAPAQPSGTRKYRDAGTPDHGLFLESVAADGTLTVLSAKGIHIGKKFKIPVPKQLYPQQDANGDDGAKDDYKFSSLHGGGPEHKVGDVRVEGETKSVLRAAAVLDLLAYDVNWRYAHPFHYHTHDYWLPNPSETEGRDQEGVAFGGDAYFVADPTPRRLRIDHRYGSVDYFERESFIRFHDDGSVSLGSGCGVDVTLAGGRLRLNAPKGIDACPGTDFTVLADQIVLRAKGSVDVSSSEKDVRLKAERNMQLVAGNGGRGGVLVESKGRGNQQQFTNKYGEDVVSNGVLLRAAESTAAVYGKDIYLRTGGADLGEGDILLDASKGKRRVQVFGREFHAYTTKAVTFNYGPIDQTSTVRRVYSFGEKTCVMDVQLLLGGKLIGYPGGGGRPGVIVDGGVYGTKAFATAGVMADKKGMFLGKVPGGFAGTIASAVNAAAQAVDLLKQAGETRHRTTVVQKYYQDRQLGNDELIQDLKFSFRDPPESTTQYKTARFQLPEARWQQFVRLGLGSGGVGWTEKPVIYQGRQTYPWPGKQKWADEPTLLRLSGLTMFDAAAGRDADRPGPYETDPAVGSLQPQTPDGEYTLSR